MINIVLARSINSSSETLDLLSYDKEMGVRYWVSMNPNTSPETLIRLVKDKDPCVRREAVKNPNTPQYIKQYIKINRTLSKLSSLITKGTYP